ncbi:serine hydrolase [Pedobacter foliorum]|uniref:serine hydrolase n=1 Tax=Pedobacter foliorum TaxID=2739058 RepID=UPI0015666799|nr:serine hydrolase [Pedobacter foliorum]NRF37633.1 class A beta-lactamase-related serine hydrolase [Pedobacter foliorum]
MKKVCSTALLFSTLIFVHLQAYPQNLSVQMKKLFDGFEQQHTLNGNVLVAEKGKILYSKSFGFANLKDQKKNTDASAFQIGSVSKTFTAVAILQLKEKGKFKLEDPLVKYFPEFPYREVTIQQLLSHTSGIPDKEELFLSAIENDPDRLFTNKDVIPAMKVSGIPLAFSPGSSWRYCNMGYALLAMLVEKSSKQTFSDYLDTHIFRPAKMHHSYLLKPKPGPNQVTGYLIRAHYLGDMESIDSSRKVRPWSYNMRGFEGPTNIISTTADLLNFDQALRSTKLLKAATINEMLSPALLTNGRSTSADGEFGKASYGLGWFLQSDTSAGKIVMHTGREPGFFSFFLRDLSHNRTLILIDNAESSAFGLACKESFNLLSGRQYFAENAKSKQSLFLAYAKELFHKGADQAITLFNQLKTDTAAYYAAEHELNDLGLELLDDHHYQPALEALKLCTILYPDSWNTYDSYAKALLETGKKEAAILMYQKSVEMNPGNEPAKKILSEIQSKP